MLEATKAGVFSRTYDITLDGRRVAAWSRRLWRNGGDITLGGQTYRVDATTFTNRFTMTDAAGRTVATAEKAGRKHWTVVADGKPHRFRRASIWGNQQDLLVGDQPVGSVRRTSMWSGRVEANLPTLSLSAQIFVMGVMITTWDRQAAAASG
jgi:hypothetical protein